MTEYDAIVTRLHQIDPAMKFVGLALAFPEREPDVVEYFLNHGHHKPGVPIDMVSYHFYAAARFEQTPDSWQFSFFDPADGFLATMRYADAIRRRLFPETKHGHLHVVSAGGDQPAMLTSSGYQLPPLAVAMLEAAP